jgi:addiction module RelE/StbE family toxin
MDYKVIWSPSARDDLKEIVVYISEENPEAAERIGLSFIEASKSLARFEKKGRKVPEFGQEGLREIIMAPYRMIYQINSNSKSLEIIRLWHGARGNPEL